MKQTNYMTEASDVNLCALFYFPLIMTSISRHPETTSRLIVFSFALTSSSSKLLFLHVFIDPPASCQDLSAHIFHPLLTQMNSRAGSLSGRLLYFLICLHDSIYLPSKSESSVWIQLLRISLFVCCIIS